MLFMLWDTTFFDPKWDLETGRSTINFDISAYYMYLPAFFIYNDAKELKWKDYMMKKYRPTNTFHQAFKHESGNWVMKHTIGQAIMYSPFFAMAHLYASASPKYESDGFSTPYQFAIFYGSLMVAFLGLFMMRKVLLQFFDEWVTTILLFCLIFGSNWYEYSTFTGAMSHNYLFGIYATLIWVTIHFYKSPTKKKAVFIGLLCGMAALTRPTELLSVIIPLLWVNDLNGKTYWNYKIDFFSKHFSKILLAVVACICVGAIQPIYWKYATGDWIVYSYQDQGFNFIRPYIHGFNFSFKTGWLVYSPIMWFALAGFIWLFRKNRNLFWVCFAFFIPFWYVAFSWKIWDYGGCIGQRTMVQAYPILLFPMGYFLQWIVSQKRWLHILFAAVVLFFSYYNWWLSHSNGIFKAGHMTEAYFWKTILTYEENQNDLKLLDATEEFIGERANVKEIYFNDFENEEGGVFSHSHSISGKISAELKGANAEIEPIEVNLKDHKSDWLRVTADFEIDKQQRLWWKHAQLKIRLYEGSYVKREQKLRLHRFLVSKSPRDIFLDIRCDDFNPKKVEVLISNMQNEHTIWVDNLKIETFDEK